MASTFFDRIDELAERVGHGTLRGTVKVDQVYAHVQHEDLTYQHPRGGGPKYLEGPLHEQHRDYLERVARATLGEEGPDPAMADAMESLSGEVSRKAPVEFGDLRESGHPSVTSDGEVVYDRPPETPRLTDEQLRSKNHRRSAL